MVRDWLVVFVGCVGWAGAACVVCSAHFQRFVYWVGVMFVHAMCTQCVVVWLQRMVVWDFVFMYWLHKAHWGRGFRSTSPLRSSRATSQPAGGRRLGAEKTADLGPPFGGQGEGVVICPPIREGYSNRAQATTFGAFPLHLYSHRLKIEARHEIRTSIIYFNFRCYICYSKKRNNREICIYKKNIVKVFFTSSFIIVRCFKIN